MTTTATITEPIDATRLRKRKLVLTIIAVSIAVHVGGGFLAAIWIIARYFDQPQAQFEIVEQVRIQPEERINRLETEQVESLRPKPVFDNRIASLSPSDLALPEMPKLQTESLAPIDTQALLNDQISEFSESMAGQGQGASGGFFGGVGKPGSGLLEGTFYDLKQTKDGEPNTIDKHIYAEILRDFAKSWREDVLKEYYSSETQLMAAQIVMPVMSAKEAPEAFSVADKVEPTNWIIHYKGQVTAPESGSYRFVGVADDVLVVRFDGKLVLDAGFLAIDKANQENNYPYQFFTANNLQSWYMRMTGGHVVGQTFRVQKGRPYDIEIVVGEQPGGEFYAQLLIENVNHDHEKDAHGNPILPFFQMIEREIPEDLHSHLPPFVADAPIWEPAPRTTRFGR